MVKRISKFVIIIAATLFIGAQNTVALAIGTINDGAGSARGLDQPVSLFGVDGTFGTITNVLLYVVGAIAVIMIVIGGLRYVLSGGNSEQVTAAKNTILYAVIGIIIAILAYAIIRFVISNFTTPGGGTNV
jgi:hypothetical protein